jgi:hypothetical protein
MTRHTNLNVALAGALVGWLTLGCSSSAEAPKSKPSTGGTAQGAGASDIGGRPSPTGGVPTGGMAAATGGTTSSGGSPAGGQRSGGNSGQPAGGTIASGGQPAGGNTSGNASGGAAANCPTQAERNFSFFLISLEAVQRESGSADGFGGNLGGLAGADAICQRVAQYVSACQTSKVWRAFLSTSTVNAIDRIGTGPWYDRNGRLLANGISDLLGDRPTNAAPQIKNDFPNEYGVPNHAPNGTTQVDNHEILTGSGTDGKVYRQTSASSFPGDSTACGDGETWTVDKATCSGWTSSEPQGCPRVGHSWPAESGTNWISVWNEGGCAPGGTLADTGGLDGTRRVGSAGGYGGWYCFAVMPSQ